jgi:membrane dipeptidase
VRGRAAALGRAGGGRRRAGAAAAPQRARPRQGRRLASGRAERARLRRELAGDPARLEAELARHFAALRGAPTPLSVLIDHIDHAVRIAGIDHVGLGGDLDGIPFAGLPEGIRDVSSYPRITAALLARGYSEAAVRKILGENFLRVLREVERRAGR